MVTQKSRIYVSYHTFVDSFQIKIWRMTNFEKIPFEIVKPVMVPLSSLPGPEHRHYTIHSNDRIPAGVYPAHDAGQE